MDVPCRSSPPVRPIPPVVMVTSLSPLDNATDHWSSNDRCSSPCDNTIHGWNQPLWSADHWNSLSAWRLGRLSPALLHCAGFWHTPTPPLPRSLTYYYSNWMDVNSEVLQYKTAKCMLGDKVFIACLLSYLIQMSLILPLHLLHIPVRCDYSLSLVFHL